MSEHISTSICRFCYPTKNRYYSSEFFAAWTNTTFEAPTYEF